ncbi:hypothetical protein ACN47E_004124 [Coniothyrium glycines]
MGILERSLEENLSRRMQPRSNTAYSFTALPGQEESYSDQEDDEDTKNLDPTYLAFEDAVYYEEEGNDDMVDLGIVMGKLRITERVGGLVRPKLSEELTQALKELPKREPTYDKVDFLLNPMSWLAPSSDFVAPSSAFFFAPGIQRSSLTIHLPSKIMVDNLISHYWNAVHTIAKTVHRPSFERQYERFWVSINSGIEPRNSFQAVVFATLLSSIISMPEHKILSDFGVGKRKLVDNFREATEAALARANFLATTKLETLQAFVMYLIPLCRNEVSRAHSALTGSLIRLAECMGLHRDPATYTSSPIEVHVRRLLWYQICFLDLRTCEATGPRPQIRPDDYDTRFPMNIDDSDLDRAEQGDFSIDVSKDKACFTDMTISRMRFECYEMHRVLWIERPKVDQKGPDGERKITLTTLLSRIQSFCAAMEKMYLPMLSNDVSLHILAAEMHGILSNRLYIMVLQRYLSNDRTKMPERLRQIVLGAATMILEHSMAIEKHPALVTWSWYIGALHQYHVALLLSNELYAGPREPAMEERVWRGLDFAFDLPSETPNLEKMRMILEELVQKTKIYADMRRIRAPADMASPGPRTHTPGYKMRQEADKVDGPGGGPSLTSTDGFDNSLYTNSAQQHQLLRQQWQQQPSQHSDAVFSFPGAIPSVDWGTDTTAVAPDLHQHCTTINHNTPQNTTNTRVLLPSVTTTNTNQMMFGPEALATYASTQLDALNEIDWSDIDRMFGGTELSAGDMIIPPFTFTQFTAADVLWPGSNA